MPHAGTGDATRDNLSTLSNKIFECGGFFVVNEITFIYAETADFTPHTSGISVITASSVKCPSGWSCHSYSLYSFARGPQDAVFFIPQEYGSLSRALHTLFVLHLPLYSPDILQASPLPKRPVQLSTPDNTPLQASEKQQCQQVNLLLSLDFSVRIRKTHQRQRPVVYDAVPDFSQSVRQRSLYYSLSSLKQLIPRPSFPPNQSAPRSFPNPLPLGPPPPPAPRSPSLLHSLRQHLKQSWQG